MSKIKYTKEITDKAISLRRAGKSIPEIIQETGMKKPSLQKLFCINNIKLNEKDKANALARRWLDHQPIVNGQKQCSKCSDWKDAIDFHQNKNRLSGLTSSCKDCYGLFYESNREVIIKRVLNYKINNPEKKRQTNKKYYEANTEKLTENASKWNKENHEKVKEIHRNYDKRTQKQKNARTAKYRAIKIQATPSWITEQQLDEISRIYQNCPPGYHVDHIVPLRGKNVRGLHVPWNLQYLPAIENMKKSNKI